jgi:hypothetical protein
MKGLLDQESPDGAQRAVINFRPLRTAIAVSDSDVGAFIEVIADECEHWGGANTPLIPGVDGGAIRTAYANILAGSALDTFVGIETYGEFHPFEATVSAGGTNTHFGRQFSLAPMKYRDQDAYRPLEVPVLANDDPWLPIYAACLGHLREKPSQSLLRELNLKSDLKFEDFLNVSRPNIVGSFEDLRDRLDDRQRMSARRACMSELAYGSRGSSSIRSKSSVLPNSRYKRYDAGPNILVLCTSLSDCILLWNLRAALGDTQILPVGILVDQFKPSMARELRDHPHIARHGISDTSLYVTSASLSEAEIWALIGGDMSRVSVAGEHEILSLGEPAGWPRDEILTFTKGRTTFVPLNADSHAEMMRGNGGTTSLSMSVDVRLQDAPFPNGADVRADNFSFTFRAGVAARWVGSAHHDPLDLEWPSPWFAARIVARGRNVDFRESEPGKAVLTAISAFESLDETDKLLHAPLLNFLETMAARSGIGFFKKRRLAEQQRDSAAVNEDIPLAESTAPSSDELPERSFHEFKQVIGNNTQATKNWLRWAEERNLVVKGFPVHCENCASNQWIPVNGFVPPIACRGCGQVIELPFGDRAQVEFKYRLGERMRRLYQQDAMGHLLALNYFNSLFSFGARGSLIGGHPGVELVEPDGIQPIFEADVLLLFNDAEFVPIEVKRSFQGVKSDEIEKLDRLAKRLKAEWSAFVVLDYAKNDDGSFEAIQQREIGSDRVRLALTFDHLLTMPFWSAGSDPFAWSPLSEPEIQERERSFVLGLATIEEKVSWQIDGLLRRPAMMKKDKSN